MYSREAGKDGEIQAISSATITSKAVTACVNAALEVVNKNAAKSTSASEEIQKTVEEITLQSNVENETAEENRKDEPTPIIVEENETEGENDGQ